MPKNPLVYALFLCAALLVTVSGLLVYEKDARARAENQLAQEKVKVIDANQMADEMELSLLEATVLADHANIASKIAREALRASLDGSGDLSTLKIPETLVVELKKAEPSPADGYWAHKLFIVQATASLKAEPIRREELIATLKREAKATRGWERSKRATKFWSKLTILTGGALAIVLLK